MVTRDDHHLSRFLVSQVYTVPFLGSGKPVFNVEYRKDYGVCPGMISMGIDTIFKVGRRSCIEYCPVSRRRKN